MNRKLLVFCYIAVSLAVISGLLRNRSKLKDERDQYRQNTESLLEGVERFRTDSAEWAADRKALQLSLREYKAWRGQDQTLIERLGIENRQLKAAATHQLTTEVGITAPIRDSVVVRDSVAERIQHFEYRDRFVDIKACIEKDTIRGDIALHTTLKQFFYREYKHKFLWWKWGTKCIRQTIVSDNPYVRVDYTEVIEIK